MTERLPELVVDRRVTLRRFSLLVASCALGVFGWFLLDDSDALNALPTSGLVAQVDGQAITQDDIRRELAPALADLDRQRQALWQQAIERRIGDLLIEGAARRAGLPPSAFLARELGPPEAADYWQRRAGLIDRLRGETPVHLFPG